MTIHHPPAIGCRHLNALQSGVASVENDPVIAFAGRDSQPIADFGTVEWVVVVGIGVLVQVIGGVDDAAGQSHEVVRAQRKGVFRRAIVDVIVWAYSYQGVWDGAAFLSEG